MTTTVHIYQYMSVTIDGKTYSWGSLVDPASVSITGLKNERVVAVAASTTVKLFDSSVDPIGSFEICWLQTDFDVMIEFVTDDNSTVGDEPWTNKLRGSGVANKYGPAKLLSYDDSYAGYVKNFGGGTLDVIDIIRARNLSATQAAQVLITTLD